MSFNNAFTWHSVSSKDALCKSDQLVRLIWLWLWSSICTPSKQICIIIDHGQSFLFKDYSKHQYTIFNGVLRIVVRKNILLGKANRNGQSLPRKEARPPKTTTMVSLSLSLFLSLSLTLSHSLSLSFSLFLSLSLSVYYSCSARMLGDAAHVTGAVDTLSLPM